MFLECAVAYNPGLAKERIAMAATTPWKRMIESEFNRRILVEEADRYRNVNVRCQILMMVLSSGAVATIAAKWSVLAVLCALATAALSALTLWKKYSDNAAQCEALANEWQRLKAGFEGAHESLESGNDLSEDAWQMLQREFDRLSGERQELPEPEHDKAVMRNVLIGLGYSKDKIDSWERGEAAA